MLLGIDHLVIAVWDLDAATKDYRGSTRAARRLTRRRSGAFDSTKTHGARLALA